jgi:hypothetical protein
MGILKTQLHANRRRVDFLEGEVNPIVNEGGGINKSLGGIWTSTYLGEELGSSWIQWCLSQEFSCPDDDIWKCYILEPKDDLNLYVINSLEDMHNMFDRYGYELFPNSMMDAIDFEKMAKDYDGLHLTEYGQVVTRFGFPFNDDMNNLKEEWKEKRGRNLYGWDMESTHHFKWNFKSVTAIDLKIGGEYSE